MRKHLLLLLALCCAGALFLASPARAAEKSGAIGDNITWTLEGTTLTVSGTGAVNGGTGLYKAAVDGEVTRIVYSEGITDIGTASNFDKVTDIEIPASVTVIPYDDSNGVRTFRDFTALKNVNVADGNEAYRSVDGVLLDKAGTTLLLYGKGRTEGAYRVPDGVTDIAPYAVSQCPGLTKLDLGSTVTKIGYDGISRCENLETLRLPDAMTAADYHKVTYNCDSIKTVILPASVTSYRDTIITDSNHNSGKSIVTYEVEEGNETYCSKDGMLLSADGTRLLAYGKGRTDPCVTIPGGVTCIDGNSVIDNPNVTAIHFPASFGTGDDSGRGMTDYAIAKETRDAVTEIACSGTVFSGNGGNGYKAYKLAWFPNLEKIIFLPGTESIATAVCAGLSHLRTAVLPDSLTEIGAGAFFGCSIQTVELPDSLTSIGDEAFSGCPIQEVTIPRDTAVGFGVFDSSTTVKGWTGSFAELAAQDCGCPFVSLGEFPVTEVYLSPEDGEEALQSAMQGHCRIHLADGVYVLTRPLDIGNQVIDLTVRADNPGRAELLLNNMYGPVVRVIGGARVTLDGLIMGHKSVAVQGCDPTGNCVLLGSSARGLKVTGCDLWGCGYIATYFMGRSGSILVEDSILRDCASSAVKLFLNMKDTRVRYVNCVISGNGYLYGTSGAGGACLDMSGGIPSFENCLFCNNRFEKRERVYNEAAEVPEEEMFRNCIFRDNIWQGETPKYNGVCLGGVRWALTDTGDDPSLPCYELRFDETGLENACLPAYSYYSMPWRCRTVEDYKTFVSVDRVVFSGDTALVPTISAQGRGASVNIEFAQPGPWQVFWAYYNADGRMLTNPNRLLVPKEKTETGNMPVASFADAVLSKYFVLNPEGTAPLMPMKALRLVKP